MPTVPKSGAASVPDPPRGRHLTALDAVKVVSVAVVLLVLFEGTALRKAGDQMQPGWERSVVLAVGKPVGSVANWLPLHKLDLFGWASFENDVAQSGGSGARTVLVTGDSLAMPLDVEVARRLAGRRGTRVVRDARLGTGVSKTDLLDWRKLSVQQVHKYRPDAIVVFIGANEGFPMPGPGGRQVQCCGFAWKGVYEARVRRIMANYRQGGKARVYWLTLPLPRDRDRQEIAHTVNSALDGAYRPFRSEVRVLDMEEVFTPDDRYRDAMNVDGRKRIVRNADGIHLNEAGAKVAAKLVLARMARDFGRALGP
jgi:uncharacterized protein